MFIVISLKHSKFKLCYIDLNIKSVTMYDVQAHHQKNKHNTIHIQPEMVTNTVHIHAHPCRFSFIINNSVEYLQYPNLILKSNTEYQIIQFQIKSVENDISVCSSNMVKSFCPTRRHNLNFHTKAIFEQKSIWISQVTTIIPISTN